MQYQSKTNLISKLLQLNVKVEGMRAFSAKDGKLRAIHAIWISAPVRAR
jgi:hypothetical protein